jgi:transcriptional repressor NrdR
MKCIYCGNAKTQITNSRPQKRTNQVWRRHHCPNCGGDFSTTEVIDFERTLAVTNKAHIEPFLRDKLLFSIYEACGHRKDANTAATALTATIISKLLPQVADASLPRQTIIITAAEVLKRFDKAASVHYTAYHPL